MKKKCATVYKIQGFETVSSIDTISSLCTFLGPSTVFSTVKNIGECPGNAKWKFWISKLILYFSETASAIDTIWAFLCPLLLRNLKEIRKKNDNTIAISELYILSTRVLNISIKKLKWIVLKILVVTVIIYHFQPESIHN